MIKIDFSWWANISKVLEFEKIIGKIFSQVSLNDMINMANILLILKKTDFPKDKSNWGIII